MTMLVWGAGAIGGTIGAYLMIAGHKVIFVDRAKDHVRAMNAKGLTITGPIAEFTISAKAYTPDEVQGEFERIFLCTKAQHTREACQALLPHLSANGYVVSMQNGLNELVIAEVVGEERTVGAFVNFGADCLEPGLIHYGGRGAVVLGELDGQITERLKDLHQLLLQFDENAIITNNIWGYLWGKLAYGALLFATALTNAPIADALDAAPYRQLYIALAREVLAVAQAQGIRPEGFNGFDPQAFMPGTAESAAERSIDDMVAFNRKSAKTHSGIWRDLAVRKRRSEVEPQLSSIVETGQRLGIPTPLTGQLIALIQEIENGARKHDWENLDVLSSVLSGR